MQNLTYLTGKVATTEEGHKVSVRATSSEDAEKLREMFSRVSPQTIYQRFHAPYPTVPDRRLDQMVVLDHQSGGSFVAAVGEEVVGHAMYVRTGEDGEAEVALVIEDDWQLKGVGKTLLRKLAREAGCRGVEVFTGAALGENRRVLGLLRSVFAWVETRIEDGSYQLRMPLRTLKPVAGHGGRTRILRHDVGKELVS